MSLKIKLAAVAVSVCVVLFGTLFFVNYSTAEKLEFWITVDVKEYQHVRESLASRGDFALPAAIELEQDGIAVLRLNDGQMEQLSSEMHDAFHKCAGFMAHDTREQALEVIAGFARADATQQLVDYTINNAANVNALHTQVSEIQNRQVILDLSAFPTRRYNQPSGLTSATWIKDKWTALAAGRSDVTVEFFTHPTATSPQPSIILTIQGTTLPSEIVVLGGHQDSINSSGGSTANAPGADDDASGIACLTEAIRVLMTTGFRPQRTVKFMAYAAEEVGLRGSNAIAADFVARSQNVVGVLQLDMTNFKGSSFDIVMFQDFTNAAQNTFVQNLITTYQPTMTIGTSSCGYGCSDHAAWHNRGFPASFPHEATFQTGNSAIHTLNDTISRSNNTADHAIKFTKLALSYVGELGKGAIAPTAKSPVDFDGDSKTDISIFRPAVGEWWMNRSSNNSTVAAQFGTATDRVVPADFTGDGKADIAFFRPADGFWYVLRSEDASFFSFPFGASGDVPVARDFDGDGKADPAVYRPTTSEWYISRSTGGTTIVTFGTSGDVPVPADYDGDSKADIAIYRASAGEWWISRSTNSTVYAFQFGSATDKPVAGDYSGDGKADAAFFRPADGNWFILRSQDNSFYSVPFGTSGDLPVPGDYDGDGKFDTAVFRPSVSTWFVDRSTSGLLIATFGAGGDNPVPNALLP